MAKKGPVKKEEVEKVEVDDAPVKTPKSTKPSKKVKPKISLEKYLQLKDPLIHKYTRSYIVVEYHDIMKAVSEWDEETKQYLDKKE